MCSNNLSIDGRGCAESLGVLNFSPVETTLGPRILPGGINAQPADVGHRAIDAVVGAIVKNGQSDELTGWRSSSAFSFEAPTLMFTLLPVSRNGIHRCHTWICVSKLAGTSAHSQGYCKYLIYIKATPQHGFTLTNTVDQKSDKRNKWWSRNATEMAVVDSIPHAYLTCTLRLSVERIPKKPGGIFYPFQHIESTDSSSALFWDQQSDWHGCCVFW